MATRSSTAPPGNSYEADNNSDGAGESHASGPGGRAANDSSHNVAASRSVVARRLRVAAENDVAFLQNRLAKLKNEELKAKGEIGKLKQKVDDVTHTRERHEQTGNQRRELQDQVDYSKRKEAAMIALNKEKQSKAIWSSKQKSMQSRREAVQQMRKQKEINACRSHILREEQREQNAKRRESIRQLHDQARVRRVKLADEKKDATRQLFEQRAQQEEDERAQKEQLAAQLVAQEAQMIYRLKRLHTEKQSALRNLADAIDGDGGSPQSAHRSRNSGGGSAPASSRPQSAAQPSEHDEGLPPI